MEVQNRIIQVEEQFFVDDRFECVLENLLYVLTYLLRDDKYWYNVDDEIDTNIINYLIEKGLVKNSESEEHTIIPIYHHVVAEFEWDVNQLELE